jgi:hypothetical protein
MDRQDIRTVAYELLHAHDSMSPVAIAGTAGVTAAEVCGALDADDRFARVPGPGHWWWALSTISHVPAMPGTRRRRLAADQAPPVNDGAVARLERQRSDARERLRGYLAANPAGVTASRARSHLGMAGDEVLDLLQGLAALGEVVTYTLCQFTFWKWAA